jgi:hypothetical protein
LGLREASCRDVVDKTDDDDDDNDDDNNEAQRWQLLKILTVALL